jgi:glutamyl-tRNA reductase
MKILVVGLNHKSASISVREKLAFNSEQTIRALRELKTRFYNCEFVLISTCNRVELYCAGKTGNGVDAATIADFFAEFQNIPLNDFRDFLYVHENEEAVRHLLTVASSLDSMVVGEGQILGQVKESYHLACTARSTGKVLNRLFHSSFTTSKKIHTTTSIANGRASVAGVAVELARQLFANISSAKVTVIGAGQMGQLLVQHLLHVGCKDITIVNRSFSRAEDMANRYGILPKQWQALPEQLITSDIVIASAAVQDYLFTKKQFVKIMNNRKKGTLLLIDITVPRNFAPAVNEIEDVYLYSVDELAEVAEQNRKAREDDIARSMQIVYEQAAGFMDWFTARDIGPLIGQMKEKFARITQDELDHFFAGAREKASCRLIADTMVKRIVNRLLHCVIKNVDTVAKAHGPTEAARLVDGIIQNAEKISAGSENNQDAQ